MISTVGSQDCRIAGAKAKNIFSPKSFSASDPVRVFIEALRQIALQLSASSLSPSSPFGHILPADAARLCFDTVGVAFSASQQRR